MRLFGSSGTFVVNKRNNLDESGYLIQRFLADIGHSRVFSRIANYQHQKRTFVGWAAENFVQESHRAGRMRQRSQPGIMDGGDEYPGGDTH